MTDDNGDKERLIILPGEDRALPPPGFRARAKVLGRRELRGLAEAAVRASAQSRGVAETVYKLLRVVQASVQRELDKLHGPIFGRYWRLPWVSVDQVKAWLALLPPPVEVAEADAKVGLEPPSADVES